MRKSIFLGILILVLDVVTKFYTQAYLPEMYGAYFRYPYGGIGVFSDFLGVQFSLVHAINRGAAWGLFAEFQKPLLYLRIILIGFLTIYVFLWNKQKELRIPLMLVLAGAVGNVLDYFIYGHVIDMFYFIFWGYSYPVFNVADSAIFIGIVWLFIQSFCCRHKCSA